MLDRIHIQNYKSIEDLSFDLGTVNVFIGENGAGKSNILEALALAGAAAAGKLDHEFLASRGIRVTAPQLMRAAFTEKTQNQPVLIALTTSDGAKFQYSLSNDNQPYSGWKNHLDVTPGKSQLVMKDFSELILSHIESLDSDTDRIEFVHKLTSQLKDAAERLDAGEHSGAIPIEVKLNVKSDLPFEFAAESNPISHFLVYSPEDTTLRKFDAEGQIEPLGINGEGLFKLLLFHSTEKNRGTIRSIKRGLKLLNWFRDISIIDDASHARMDLSDIYIKSRLNRIDQRSINEGFLYVAFYLTLFASRVTPRLFAIDNIDASLNPRLCQTMMQNLVQLAKDNGKQAILTTHNPAILDGLDLTDDEQRLFVVSRSRTGRTRIRRFKKEFPKGLPTRMSELFLRGALGGLPKNF